MKKFLTLSLALLAGCLIAAEIQLYPMSKPNKYISGFALYKDAQYYWFMFQLTPEAPQDLVIDCLYVNTDKDKNTGRKKVGNEYYVVAAKNSITSYTKEGKEIGGRKKGKKQIEYLPHGIIVKDDIEIGHENIVPLWQFGLNY